MIAQSSTTCTQQVINAITVVASPQVLAVSVAFQMKALTTTCWDYLTSESAELSLEDMTRVCLAFKRSGDLHSSFFFAAFGRRMHELLNTRDVLLDIFTTVRQQHSAWRPD